MSEPRVWAPGRKTVEIDTGQSRRAMVRDEGSWWRCPIELGPGAEYSFRLDGGPARPDPRSPCQPHGVQGPSRTVAHEDYRWTDDKWRGAPLRELVVYEMHVGTFSPQGTFDGAAAMLGHLVDLGVGAVEMMPVATFPGSRGWGYDGVDLYAPHETYGGPLGLKRFVDACHSHGLAVILDVVYNHLGPDGNYLSEFGPYFSDRYSTPWGGAVNLDDRGSNEVRAFFIDNALMWLQDYHFDGLRIDAIHAIYDMSATHFLEELATKVAELETRIGRELFVIAESDLNDPRVVTDRELGGYGIDAQWSDDFHHSLHAALTGDANGYYADFGRIADIAAALTRAFVYDGRYSGYRDRIHGRSAAHLPGHRFLGYLQTHDQVGNRARGERSSALMSPELLKVGAALVLTAPFVPMLFQGEEWGATSPFLYFTDHADPKLGRAVSEGRKREFAAFGWPPEDVPDPQDPETFERSRLDWSELEEPGHADLFEWHRDLIRLRRDTPALSDGRMDRVATRFDEDARWLVVERGPVTVACNLSGSPRTVALEGARTSEIALTSGKAPQVAGDKVTLEPESVTIFVGK